MTQTVGEALAALGVEPPDGLEPCLVEFDARGKPHNRPLAGIAGRDVAADFPRGLFLAGGLFPAGVLSEFRGRARENAARVMWLAFDADVSAFLGIGRGDEAGLAAMRSLPQSAIDEWLREMRAGVEDAFAAIRLPLHRLDCTGYGLCAYVTIDPAIRGKVANLDRLYKHVHALLNEAAGDALFDDVKDAGSRITRIPGSVNAKNPEMPRSVRTVFRQDGYLDAATANRLMETAPAWRPARLAPVATGQRIALEPDKVDAIVGAIAPFYGQGSRHALAMNLAGMLAKAGVGELQAQHIIELLAVDDEEPWDRLRCVRTSYERVRNGQEVRGYQGLRDLLGPSGAAQLDYVASMLRPPVPRLVLPSPAVDAPSLRREAWPDPPESCWRPWFARYLALVAPCTEAPPAFHLAAALAVAGSVVGRRAWMPYLGRLYPNLYCLLVGSAGRSRKSTAMRMADSWRGVAEGLSFWTPPFSVVRDATTSAFLLKHLSENQTTLLLLDEYTRLLKTAKREYAADVPTLILSLYDGEPVEHNVASGTTRVEQPHFSILAGIQPGVLATEMAGTDLRNGFVSRFLHFPGEGANWEPWPPSLDRAALARLFRELDAFADVAGEVRLVDAARDAWGAWYVADKERPVASETEDAARVRLADNALKVALLYAVSEGAAVVWPEHLQAALDLVEWQWACVRSMLPQWGATVTRRIQSRIERALSERPMTRWEVMRAVDDPDWDLEQASKVFDLLHRNDMLAGNADGTWVLRAG